MLIQLAILTVILISIPFAGLGLRLFLQPHSTQVNRNREMVRRNIRYMKEGEPGVISSDKTEAL